MSDIEESDLSDVSNEPELSDGLESSIDDDQLLSEEEEVEEYEEEEEEEEEQQDVNLVLDPDDEEFDPEPKAYEEDEFYDEDDEYEEIKPSKNNKRSTIAKKLNGKTSKSSLRSTPSRGTKLKRASQELDDEEDYELPKSKRSRSKNIIKDDDEDSTPTGLDQDLLLTDEEEWEMNTGPTNDISRMTERQRSKLLEKQSLENGIDSSSGHNNNASSKYNIDADQNGLLQLSNEPSKRKVFTEEELQLRKAETARKRRNFTEKKLEEEKQDTLNKLLKKRANKVRDIKSLNDDDDSPSREQPRRPMLAHKLLLRYISTKDKTTLSIPYAV